LRWSRSVVQSLLDGIEWSEEDSPGNKDAVQKQVIINSMRFIFCGYISLHVRLLGYPGVAVDLVSLRSMGALQMY
jgi:hypothetical protein